MPIFIERFVLPLFVATVVALAWTNPMGFDVQQRISGALTLIFAAYFLAHTIYKGPVPAAPPPPHSEGQTLPPNRPQLLIVKWGQIDPDKAARASHTVQQGFYIKNFGLGETAIGVKVTLTVPMEVPDVWTSGEGSTPTIAIGKDQEVFVPVWRKLGGYLIGHVLTRFDLQHFLMQTYQNTFGNKEIPVTIRYSSNGMKYITRQRLIYSPEQRYIVGFGDPEQSVESQTSP